MRPGKCLLGRNIPTPSKGKVPSYNSDKAKLLQEKFDELVHQGVLSTGRI